jgi:peptidoglycan/LPS O-acetylase OafA/YrhL
VFRVGERRVRNSSWGKLCWRRRPTILTNSRTLRKTIGSQMLDHKRRNNFDFARLFLAMTVVIGHLVWILPGDYGILQTFVDHFDGPTAVDCFFVISGFLIFRSFRRSKTTLKYWENRVCRIYPALVAIIMMTVIWGAVITNVGLHEYASIEALRYIVVNLIFLSYKQNTLPGLFEHNEVHYVNAALWTLKIEVMFYAVVPILSRFARRVIRFEVIAVVIYVLSVSFRILFHYLAVTSHSATYEQWGSQLPGQLSFFMVGGLLEYCSEAFRRYAYIYLTLGVLGLIVSSRLGVYALYPASLGIVVIYICGVFPYMGHISKYGDFSYGLYVCHFPIIQSFAMLSVLAEHPGLRAVIALGSCLLYAALSWHLVEKRWLRPKEQISRILVSQGRSA